MNVPILNMAMQVPVNYQTEFECLTASLDALESSLQVYSYGLYMDMPIYCYGLLNFLSIYRP